MFHVVLLGGLLTLTPTADQAISAAGRAGQLSGRVLASETNQPIANARVFLHPIPYPVGSRAAVAITNRAGEYVFSGLEPGAYGVSANELGYFPTPGTSAWNITVAEWEKRDGVDVFMSKGGTLAGRVLDQRGKPLQDVFVFALGHSDRTLDYTVASVTTARTDEAGRFRVQSLPPGTYVVVANRRMESFGPVSTAYRVIDSQTYFPGTLDIRGAQAVTVAAGETVGGLDFTAMTAPLFTVSGIAVDDSGHPVSGARVALEADWPKFGGPKGSSVADAEGRFAIDSIVPGRYTLTVTGPGSKAELVTRETPFVRVTVADADVRGLVVPVPIR